MEIVPAFEVLESCSLDPRRLKECVRRHEVDVQEVKIRGIDRAPESLRRSLRNPGSPPATLIVGRSTHGPYAALTRRCIATDPIPSDPV